jgi:hypothetical protein
MNAAIEQLMHDVLDDEAGPEQRAELERRLEHDPGARIRFEEIRELFVTLGRVEMAEAPADLHSNVMRALAHEASPERSSRWMDALAAMFRARPVPAFAMAVVSAAAVGVLLWAGLNGGSAFKTGASLPVTGTMAPPAAGERLDLRVLNLEGTALEVETRSTELGLDADLRFAAPAGATVTITHDPEALVLHPERAGNLIPRELVLEPGLIRFDIRGNGHYRLPFQVIESTTLHPLHVNLRSAGGAVEEDVLAGPGGAGP